MGAAETAWRFVVQRRVRSLVIVLFAPFVQLIARLTHALELDSTQYLVAHRPVEAFYLPVLRRLPRTRELERYSPRFAPLLHIPTPKFRSVVALYRLRLAVQKYQPVQRLRNVVASEASRHLATQAFTTVVVYHVQYPIALLFSNTSYIKSMLHLSFICFGCPLFTRSNRRSLRRLRLPI